MDDFPEHWWEEISDLEIYVWQDVDGHAVFLYFGVTDIYWNMWDTNIRDTGQKAIDGPVNWEWM